MIYNHHDHLFTMSHQFLQLIEENSFDSACQKLSEKGIKVCNAFNEEVISALMLATKIKPVHF